MMCVELLRKHALTGCVVAVASAVAIGLVGGSDALADSRHAATSLSVHLRADDVGPLRRLDDVRAIPRTAADAATLRQSAPFRVASYAFGIFAYAPFGCLAFMSDGTIVSESEYFNGTYVGLPWFSSFTLDSGHMGFTFLFWLYAPPANGWGSAIGGLASADFCATWPAP